MSILQTWYGLSDYEIEERVKDSLSFNTFVGLQLEDDVPDHSTLSRFRTALTQAGCYEKLLATINLQLERNQLIVTTGVIVDASLSATRHKPKGKTIWEVSTDRQEDSSDQAATTRGETAAVPLRESIYKNRVGKIGYNIRLLKTTH